MKNRSLYQKVKQPILLLTLLALASVLLPAQSAFAATQTVAATGTWRSVTNQENSDIAAQYGGGSDSSPGLTPGSANPSNANLAATGWVPDGSTDPRTGISNRVGIALDLPRIDLSCGTNVELSIDSGNLELLSTSLNSDADYGWYLVNSHNELVSYSYQFLEDHFSMASPGSASIAGAYTINPSSPSFGLKLFVFVQAFDGASGTAAWDVSDLAVSFRYDDNGGGCQQSPAPLIPTSCNDSYLDTRGINLETNDVSYFNGLLSPQAVMNVVGDPDAVRASSGFSFNPNVDEVSTSDVWRAVELDFTPQSILETAGAIEIRVDLDRDYTVNPLSENAVYTFFTTTNGVQAPWAGFEPSLAHGADGFSTYLHGNELSDVRIFFLVATYQIGSNTQLSSILKNARVTVSHLEDTAVCGISVTNQAGNATTTTTQATGVAAASGIKGSLPETGSSSSVLFGYATLVILLGLFLRIGSRQFRFGAKN